MRFLIGRDEAGQIPTALCSRATLSKSIVTKPVATALCHDVTSETVVVDL